MANTRAKFSCTGVTKRQHWQRDKGFIYDASFTAVTSGLDENKGFFEATPNGSISLSTLRDDFFQVGKDYYVDFTIAE